MYTDALFGSVSVFILPLPPLLGTQPTCLGWKNHRHNTAKTPLMFIMFRSFSVPIPKKKVEESRCTSWRGQPIWSSNRMKWFTWFDFVKIQHRFGSIWHWWLTSPSYCLTMAQRFGIISFRWFELYTSNDRKRPKRAWNKVHFNSLDNCEEPAAMQALAPWAWNHGDKRLGKFPHLA